MPTKLLIILVTTNAVLGQLLLKHALSTFGGRSALESMGKLVSQALISPWTYLTIAVQAVGFLLWMTLVAREKVGVATASVGAGFYILMPLCAWAIYGESLTSLQWLGMSLITIGVTCVSLQTL
jgi:drug/metabolite transporter (DMT)-like permease